LTVGYRRGGDQLRRGILTGEEHDTERWLREVAIAGSAETVAERFVAPRTEFGFGGFQLVTGFLLVWTAPDGIKRARMRSLKISDKGGRPWNRLAELAWIRRNTFWSFTE
jgi:hypothetical protein